MVRYSSIKQLAIEDFDTTFYNKLNPANKWVQLAQLLPWDDLVFIYTRKMSTVKGRPSISARLAVSSLIIKHMEGLDDRGVVMALEENIYLQYFAGYSSFRVKRPFDPSLLVTIRKRMGIQEYDDMTSLIINIAEPILQEIKKNKEDKKKKTKSSKSNKAKNDENKEEQKMNENDSSEPMPEEEIIEKESESTEAPIENKGKLKLDATVCDQMILYPTDLGLVSRSREESERIIDILFEKSALKIKPRTYRIKAKKESLNTLKKKRKTEKEIRKVLGKQLNYLKRNIRIIHSLLDEFDRIPLVFRDLKIFWTIQLIYDQQVLMYKNRVHSCENRIVNIYQPYVRPIPRGKDKHKIEFGAKIGVSEIDGFSRVDNFSWEAYNETTDLETQVENYKSKYGFYPECLLVDQIYLSIKNRQFLKEKGIRHTGIQLGRPKPMTRAEKKKLKEERGERNHIEGKFGQGKNAYELSMIRMRRSDTSKSAIAGIFFVMNLVRLLKITRELSALMVIFMAFHVICHFFTQLKSKSRTLWAVCMSKFQEVGSFVEGVSGKMDRSPGFLPYLS